jgi:heme/copper-type cytochrome/quinol oxidase subunit 3
MSTEEYVFGGRREPDVPHTTEARGGRAVASALSQRLGFPAAWWGIAMVIASEATLMGSFIGTYYYLRLRAVDWPPPGIPEPRVVVPVVLAFVLASTSVPMYLATRAARAGRAAATFTAIFLALIVQTGYFAYEVHDFADQLKQFTPQTDTYGSIYYVLLGADHAHVALGMLLNAWLLTKLVRGLTTYRANGVIAVAWYWYFTSAVTLAVIGTLTSVVPL